MSKKVDTQTAKELEEIKNWVQTKNEDWLTKTQEIMLTVLYLLTNQVFKENIGYLRTIYNIPKKFYESGKNDDKLSNEQLKWIDEQTTNPPFICDHEDIIKLCNLCGVDSERYGQFVINYLYFGKVTPIPFYTGYSWIAIDEFKYKARIETVYKFVDKGFGNNRHTEAYIDNGHIRFYKDTTINQLIKFIKANKKDIRDIQTRMTKYPHSKKYGRFKRDIQIYILHLLGQNSEKIAQTIQDENIPADVTNQDKYKIYEPEETAVRQIISDIESKIRALKQQIPESVSRT